MSNFDYCPNCGEKSRYYPPMGSPRGFKKIPHSTYLYQCYECGYKTHIKPITNYDVKDLRY